jgi:hypothetical protein
MSEESDNKKEPLWKIIAALTPLILGVCVTGTGVLLNHNYNKQQIKLNELTLMDKFKGDLISENSIDRGFAYAAFDALGYSDIALKLIATSKDAAGRTLAQKVNEAKDTASDEKKNASSILSSLPNRIDMQIANDEQKTEAETIRTYLKKLGNTVSLIEIVGAGRSTSSTEVRYFFESDKEAASYVVGVLQSFVKIDAPKFVRGYEKTAKKGNVEIWLAK